LALAKLLHTTTMPKISAATRDQLRSTAPLIALVALFAVLSIATESFFDLYNFGRLLSAAAIPLVLVMGATFIILTGSIDLSVEGVIAVSAVLVSILVRNSMTGFDIGLWAALAPPPRCWAATQCGFPT